MSVTQTDQLNDTHECLHVEEEHTEDAMARAVETEEVDDRILHRIAVIIQSMRAIIKNDLPLKQRTNRSAIDDADR